MQLIEYTCIDTVCGAKDYVEWEGGSLSTVNFKLLAADTQCYICKESQVATAVLFVVVVGTIPIINGKVADV